MNKRFVFAELRKVLFGLVLISTAFSVFINMPQIAQAHVGGDQVIDVSVTCYEPEAHRNGSGFIYEWVISASAQVESNHSGKPVHIEISYGQTPTTSSGTGSASVSVTIPGSSLPQWAATASTYADTDEGGHGGSLEQCTGVGQPGGDPEGPAASGTITASPNPCTIPSGLAVCTSNISYTTSNVSFAQVYVSFNGGPESFFTNSSNCTSNCPAPFITKQPDFYTFRLYNASNAGQRDLLSEVRVTGVGGPPNNNPSRGNFDGISCTATASSLNGWAYDPASPSESINVWVYRDGALGQGGVFLGSLVANQSRPDVNQAGVPGNHGFSLSPIYDSLRDGASHSVYIYAINANGMGPYPLLSGSPKTVQCPVAPTCPDPTTVRVVLSDRVIHVGEQSIAIAPTGWSGGSFTTGNSSIATATPGINGTGIIAGVAVGGTDVGGVGWTSNAGATGCSLGPASINVEAAAIGRISARPNPIVVCAPLLTGSTTFTAYATTAADVRIDNAQGLPNNTLYGSIAAFEERSFPSGPWVKSGTRARLMSRDTGAQLAEVEVGVKSDNCILEPQKPVVDLKAVNSDGSVTDGPVSVSGGSSVPLRWESQNTTQCRAVNGWTQSTAVSGQQTVGPIITSKVYTIICEGPGGQAEDSVVVNVVLPPPPDQPDSWVDNSSTGSSELGVACDRILVTWTRIASADAYRIYYYDTLTQSWKVHPDGQVAAQTAQVYTVAGRQRLGKEITPINIQTAYRYRVYSIAGAQETAPTKDATGSPIAAVPCDEDGEEGDLSPSNKDIIKIRNINLKYDTLVDQDHAVGPALPVIEGDLIGFAINLVNGGTAPITSPIQVDDVMTNLVEPPNGFNVKATCIDNGQCTVSRPSYDSATRRISMKVTPTPGNSLAPKSQEAWTITFTAKTEAPSGRRGQPFRFQNKAYVNGVTGPLLITPYILVLPVGAPTIEEIQ